jgi:NADP-dependent alcohol dehydrogenase
MNNFTFYNPVKVLFGAGQIENISKEIPKESNVLLLYGGGSIIKTGVHEQILNALDHQFNVHEFGGIEPNPTYETLLKALDYIRLNNIDFLLAVGGGSVIDGTKFLAAAAHLDDVEPWDILLRKVKIKSAMPFGVVLTLPATGSELNSNAVISKKQTQEKLAFGHPLLHPKFSIMDPRFVSTLPKRQIRNGIIDAYIHVIEQYLTFSMNAEVQDRWSESLLLALKETGSKVLKSPDDYEHAANLMWEAGMALNGLLRCGVPEDWSTHMIGHELTALHGIDHAESLAIVLPGVLHEMRMEKESKLLQYADRVWNIKTGSKSQKIDAAIQQTEHFFHTLDMKTRLPDYGIGENTILEIKKRFSLRPGFSQLGETGTITPERVEKLLKTRL